MPGPFFCGLIQEAASCDAAYNSTPLEESDTFAEQPEGIDAWDYGT